MSLEETLAPLARARVRTYADQDLPCPTDDAVIDLLRTYEAATPAERASMRARISDEHSWGLLHFAHRMAELAVRTRDAAYVRWGLLGIALEHLLRDARETTLVLSLLDHSATKLRAARKRLFVNAAALADAETARVLREFVDRPPGLRSIAAMGYVESEESGRFIYERTW